MLSALPPSHSFPFGNEFLNSQQFLYKFPYSPIQNIITYIFQKTAGNDKVF